MFVVLEIVNNEQIGAVLVVLAPANALTRGEGEHLDAVSRHDLVLPPYLSCTACVRKVLPQDVIRLQLMLDVRDQGAGQGEGIGDEQDELLPGMDDTVDREDQRYPRGLRCSAGGRAGEALAGRTGENALELLTVFLVEAGRRYLANSSESSDAQIPRLTAMLGSPPQYWARQVCPQPPSIARLRKSAMASACRSAGTTVLIVSANPSITLHNSACVIGPSFSSMRSRSCAVPMTWRRL